MFSLEEFIELASSAYQHLYDFVYLRKHPLTGALDPETAASDKERGWQLHNLLLDLIKELYPGPHAPPYSKAWRRHQLMMLRYVDGLEPQQVADQLAVSRRQYYREHGAAIEAIASILWNRYQEKGDEATRTLLQDEIDRIDRHEAYANLNQVVEGVVSLLSVTLAERHIQLDVQIPHSIPLVIIGHNLLRQVLLGVLGFLIEDLNQTRLALQATMTNGEIHLDIRAEPDLALSPDLVAGRIEPFQKMLHLRKAGLSALESDRQVVGFRLKLPGDQRASVLVVDDNEDMLALYDRYLTANHYQVLRANSGEVAIEMAIQLQPSLVILDLMMPDQDGWEVLRSLSTNPATGHIPILICSVLKQRELALTLGATAFLEKPVTEAGLLAVLDTLEHE